MKVVVDTCIVIDHLHGMPEATACWRLIPSLRRGNTHRLENGHKMETGNHAEGEVRDSCGHW